jgi:hypothetical protein
MALSDEQRTMLQLLLEGGQGYDDIGGLLGISGDEVRTRAREALREMGGADPDATVGLTDFLLGKADPIGRADAVRQLQNDPDAGELASRLSAQLRLVAPRAQLPEIPPPRRGARAPSPTPPPPPVPGAESPAPGPSTPAETPPGESLPGRISKRVGGVGSRLGGKRGRGGDRRLLFGLGAAALLIVAVVIGVVVSGGGDEGSDSSTPTGASTDPNLTIVPLAPLSEGSDASGQAVFARAGDQPVLQINLNELEPTTQDQNYVVWLYNSDAISFPLARDRVGESGDLTGAAPVPNAIVPLLPQFGCIDVSLASNQETEAALKGAVKGKSLPKHAGESILRGQIPREGTEAGTGADSDCTAAAEAAAANARTDTTGTSTSP